MYPQVFPVIGAVPDNFGWDGNPYDGDPGFNPDDSHSGHDIFGVNGQEEVSATPGTVSKVGWNDSGGWRVGITDPDGWYHYYAHMQEGTIAVEVGQYVQAGQFIGRMNQSGEAAATSPHLHYGIQVNGEWLSGFFQALIDAYNLGGNDVDGMIRYLYMKWLGREADPAGLDYWVRAVVAGTPIGEAERQFRIGQERINVVKSIYENVLRRDADEEGLVFWAGSGLSIAELYKTFAMGEEHVKEHTKTPDANDTIVAEIRKLLG
jgi:murein DD-endopeptidase MepM/ murein hydrolase activator NlpD